MGCTRMRGNPGAKTGGKKLRTLCASRLVLLFKTKHYFGSNNRLSHKPTGLVVFLSEHVFFFRGLCRAWGPGTLPRAPGPEPRPRAYGPGPVAPGPRPRPGPRAPGLGLGPQAPGTRPGPRVPGPRLRARARGPKPKAQGPGPGPGAQGLVGGFGVALCFRGSADLCANFKNGFFHCKTQ